MLPNPARKQAQEPITPPLNLHPASPPPLTHHPRVQSPPRHPLQSALPLLSLAKKPVPRPPRPLSVQATILTASETVVTADILLLQSQPARELPAFLTSTARFIKRLKPRARVRRSQLRQAVRTAAVSMVQHLPPEAVLPPPSPKPRVTAAAPAPLLSGIQGIKPTARSRC